MRFLIFFGSSLLSGYQVQITVACTSFVVLVDIDSTKVSPCLMHIDSILLHGVFPCARQNWNDTLMQGLNLSDKVPLLLGLNQEFKDE